jgi:hypothetical protein
MRRNLSALVTEICNGLIPPVVLARMVAFSSWSGVPADWGQNDFAGLADSQ